MRFTDLTGQRFGRWLVLSRVESIKLPSSTKTRYLCRCDCGSERIVQAGNLISGLSLSCGCEKIEKTILRLTKHGNRRGGKSTRTYRAWSDMLQRCNNPRNSMFHYYGGRGIKVCDRWLGERGFENFLVDMGECLKGLTLERINSNGNYEPGNCKWATPLEQGNNTRRNVRINIDGAVMTMAQLCRSRGLKYARFRYLYMDKKLPLEYCIQEAP